MTVVIPKRRTSFTRQNAAALRGLFANETEVEAWVTVVDGDAFTGRDLLLRTNNAD